MSRYVTPAPLHLQHVPLEDAHLRLEPLAEAHIAGLVALFEPSIWRWYSVTIDSPAAIERLLRAHFTEPNTLAYAARCIATGELVGSSAYLNIARKDRRVEIGSTWWHPRWQRTFVNSSAKQLMLQHAFVTMGALAVELRTDALNARSRRAIERIGGRYSGLLPQHRICDDGRLRDTVVYTLLDTDWPLAPLKVAGTRLARLSDLDVLGDMRHALWPDAGASDHAEDARALIEGSTGATLPSTCFVAEDDGVVTGFIDVALRSHAEDCDISKPVGFIEGWFVQPSQRKRGIGRRLMQVAEAWSRRIGCTELASNTWAEHTLSIDAHKALGFEVLERIISFKKPLR